MSSQHIQAFAPGMAPRVSRAGSLRAVVNHRLAHIGRVIWQAFEAQGRLRTDRELRALADRWSDTHPKLARELRSYLRGGSSY